MKSLTSLKILLIVLALFGSNSADAYIITGRVLDFEGASAPGEPVEVEVRLPGDLNSEPLAKTISDFNGNFRVTLDQRIPEFMVNVESDNYFFNSKVFQFRPRSRETEVRMFVTSVSQELNLAEPKELGGFTIEAIGKKDKVVRVRLCDDPMIQPVTGRLGFARGIHFGKRADKLPKLRISTPIDKKMSGKIKLIREKSNSGQRENSLQFEKMSTASVGDDSGESFSMLAEDCIEFAVIRTKTAMLGVFWPKPTVGSECGDCSSQSVKVPSFNVEAGGDCGPWSFQKSITTSWSVNASLSANIIEALEAEIGGSFTKTVSEGKTISAGQCEYAGIASTTVYQFTCYQITDCDEDPVYVIVTKAVKTPKRVSGVKGCNNIFPCTKTEKKDGNTVSVPCEEPPDCGKKGEEESEEEEVPCPTCPNFIDYSTLSGGEEVAAPGTTLEQLRPVCSAPPEE